jgi:hypothetical protein
MLLVHGENALQYMAQIRRRKMSRTDMSETLSSPMLILTCMRTRRVRLVRGEGRGVSD